MILINSIKPLFYSCKFGLAHSKLIVKHVYSKEIQTQKKSFHTSNIRQNKLKKISFATVIQVNIKTQLSGNI